ncbi:MAG: acyl-CoA thioesterase [Gemmatimonadetes bacterium]|nr:acyl-CoA thioesterase [Gemmatimonadota bacterium]
MPDTPQRTASVEFRVRYAETDQMGIVYHSHYLVWCEVGRTDYIRRLGMPYAEIERRGPKLAVSEATLRYHAPARYDDLVRVETTLADVRSRTLTFEYRIVNAETGARLVTAATTLISLVATGRPTAFTGDFRARMDADLPA